MRVLVTGSRRWDDEATIHAALDAVANAALCAGYSQLVVVHGAARGADTIADGWVRSQDGLELHVTAERYPALWRKFGKRAGMVRNQQMVATRPELVLAFIRDGSPGATHCAELADEVGIPLRVWHYGEQGVTALEKRHLADEDVI